MNVLKIGLINQYNNNYNLEHIIKDLNKKNPKIIVFLGNLVSTQNKSEQYLQIHDILKLFSQQKTPTYFMPGNKELKSAYDSAFKNFEDFPNIINKAYNHYQIFDDFTFYFIPGSSSNTNGFLYSKTMPTGVFVKKDELNYEIYNFNIKELEIHSNTLIFSHEYLKNIPIKNNQGLICFVSSKSDFFKNSKQNIRYIRPKTTDKNEYSLLILTKQNPFDDFSYKLSLENYKI